MTMIHAGSRKQRGLSDFVVLGLSSFFVGVGFVCVVFSSDTCMLRVRTSLHRPQTLPTSLAAEFRISSKAP